MNINRLGILEVEDTPMERLKTLCAWFEVALQDPEAYLDPNDFDIDSFKTDMNEEA